MNVYIKKITIILFGLLLIASCGKKAEDATTTAIEDTTVVEPTQTAEEKARLAAEGERMRAASVARESTVGKQESAELRSEADFNKNKHKSYNQACVNQCKSRETSYACFARTNNDFKICLDEMIKCEDLCIN
jgi:hypothetical protein